MNTPAELPSPALDPDRWSRAWPVVVLASTMAVVILSVVAAPAVLRDPVTVWFIAVCPGIAVVRLLRLDRPTAEVMLGVALSLALAGLVPSIQLYLGVWSPGLTLALLVLVTAAALALDLHLIPLHRWDRPRRAVRLRVTGLVRIGDPGALGPLAAPSSARTRPAPLPVSVVRRLPQASGAAAKGSRAESALGSDPLAKDAAPKELGSSFDRVVGDIAHHRRRGE